MNEMRTSFNKDSIFLGTAGWGDKVEKSAALELLSTFYQHGYRWIDTATNYPINRNPKDYGLAIGWLSEFQSDFPDLKIFVKAGSRTNLGEPESFINASYFDLLFEMLIGQLGDGLAGLGVHWDNNSSGDDRSMLLDFFAQIHHRGYQIGLSGIAHKESYSRNSISPSLPWIYQLNLSPARGAEIESEIAEIRKHFPKARICGYNTLGGISARGLVTSPNRMSALSASVGEFEGKNENDILNRVIRRALENGVDALIIGPTHASQVSQWNLALSGSRHD